jgi:hypothetical protein
VNCRTLVFGLLFAMLASFLSATSAMDVGPLYDVDELSIEVMIGSSLALESHSARELFSSDTGKADVFKRALITTAAQHLQQAGVRVSSTQDTVLMISIYGGQFIDSGCDRNFYSVEVAVCSSEEDHCQPWSTLLGVASDARLSDSLLTTVLAVVDEFIEKRSRYREMQKPAGSSKQPPNPADRASS